MDFPKDFAAYKVTALKIDYQLQRWRGLFPDRKLTEIARPHYQGYAKGYGHRQGREPHY